MIVKEETDDEYVPCTAFHHFYMPSWRQELYDDLVQFLLMYALNLSVLKQFLKKINIWVWGDKQGKWCGNTPDFVLTQGHHAVDLVEITQHPVMINGDPSKGQVCWLATVDWPILFHQPIIHCKRVANPSVLISPYTPDMKGNKSLSKQKARAWQEYP